MLRAEEIKKLKMKKGNDDSACNCFSNLYYGQVRWCDKHRPTGLGTHGRKGRKEG